MQIIPVIDLKNGIVVHAKHGNRNDYAPLKSGICKSSDIIDVIEAFVTLYHCTTLYIADLNAITRLGNNATLLADVITGYPDITFWVDSGYPLCDDGFRRYGNFVPVLGSESFLDSYVNEISQFKNKFVLSLDYSATGKLGASTLFSKQDLWPKNIIIMSLPRVGSNLGPDLDKLAFYRNQYPQHNFIAAGGVRNTKDLEELGRIGIQQALVATALHTGNINPDDIANLQAKKYPD